MAMQKSNVHWAIIWKVTTMRTRLISNSRLISVKAWCVPRSGSVKGGIVDAWRASSLGVTRWMCPVEGWAWANSRSRASGQAGARHYLISLWDICSIFNNPGGLGRPPCITEHNLCIIKNRHLIAPTRSRQHKHTHMTAISLP